jgi:hypothetical protein
MKRKYIEFAGRKWFRCEPAVGDVDMTTAKMTRLSRPKRPGFVMRLIMGCLLASVPMPGVSRGAR